MSNKVVYILGAGFSAPLGVPVMKTFIDKARQLKRQDPHKFKYFEDIVSLVQNTVTSKDYFKHDSKNIEEALSFLEVKDNAEGGNNKNLFVDFIADVIKYSTPIFPPINASSLPGNFWQHLFTDNSDWIGYCSFVSSLHNLGYRNYPDNVGHIDLVRQNKRSETKYSIISLNYDMVLENVCDFLNQSYIDPYGGFPVKFLPPVDNEKDDTATTLIKLHGSIDTKEIIPPTFNKGIYGVDFPKAWKTAYRIISEANELRIIGYSLPLSDSYIKFLIMAAVDKLRDLDVIDWITLDPTGEVEKRVNEFITFGNVHFKNASTQNYLMGVFNSATKSYNADKARNSPLFFSRLESWHHNFISSE